MNRIWKLVTFGVSILLAFILFRLFFMSYYYDFLEYLTLRDKIVWTMDTKLTWKDFENENNETGQFTKVGLSSRYNVDNPILFRSKTVFIPKESYATDTTDILNLRIAQAKFNLLEIYRRKMILEVDSLRKAKVDFYKPSDFKKMNKRYYDMFDRIWQGHLDSEDEMESLTGIEKMIKKELK